MVQPIRRISKSKAARLSLEERFELEARITDEEAELIDFEVLKNKDLNFEHFTNLPWRRYLFEFFGPIQDKTILDLGCGSSNKSVIFALAGARVCACDVSPKAVALVQRLAEENGVADRVTVKVSPAEALDFANESFDLVFGDAVLHHLDLKRAGPEVARVMRQGAKGGFVDGLGHNPLLEFARDYLPYHWKAKAKGTDKP